MASRALATTGAQTRGPASRLHALPHTQTAPGRPPHAGGRAAAGREAVQSTLRPGHRLGTPLPSRVAVVRALPGLGDMLCLVPALRALRAALPDAYVTLVGLESGRLLLERFPRYLDDLLVLPGGLDEFASGRQDVPAFLAEAAQRSFDLALQLHGSGSISNGLTLLLGARMRAGTYPAGGFCPDPARFVTLTETLPEVRRLLRVLDVLGIPAKGDDLEFPVTDVDRFELASIPRARRLQPGRYVVVHPGSSAADRRWPARHFAIMVNLLGALRLPVVLTGTADEIPVVHEVAEATRTETIDLAGQTSVGALASLVENARLVLCNDTGISHLTAALRVPSVVVFTGSELERWAPIDDELHVAVRPSPGLDGVEDVLSATLSLLGGERRAA